MTIDEARNAIYKRWVAQWGTRTVFTLENEPFDEPKTDAWARVSVRHLGGGQSTLGREGNRKYRREISVIIQIFWPLTEGMKEGDGHAQTARAIFEGVRFDGLCFNDGQIRELPVTDGNKYKQTNVEVFGDYEEIK